MQRLGGEQHSPCWELQKGEGRPRRKRIPDTTKNLKCQTEGLRSSQGQQGAIEAGGGGWGVGGSADSAVTAFSRVTDPFYRWRNCSLGIREVQRAAPGHTAGQEQRKDSTLGLMAPKPLLILRAAAASGELFPNCLHPSNVNAPLQSCLCGPWQGGCSDRTPRAHLCSVCLRLLPLSPWAHLPTMHGISGG